MKINLLSRRRVEKLIYYKKNKGFIPKKLVEEEEGRATEGEKRGLIIIFILVILLFPSAFKRIFKKEEEINKPVVASERVNQKEKLLYDLSIGESINYLESKGNIIKIEVDSYQKIKDIEKKEGINITTINNCGNNKFIIEIRR